MSELTKVCSKCKEIRLETDYYKNGKKNGLRRKDCKFCSAKNRIENNDKLNKQKKDWYLKNKKEHNKKSLENYELNKESYNKRSKNWCKKNRDTLRIKEKIKYNSDPMFKLKKTVRSRIYNILNVCGYQKNKKTESMLGCNFEELQKHLTSQFQEGMTLKNQGLWHVDHKIPLSSANTIDELIELCHYTNLQPLWAIDNLKKGGNYNEQL